MDNIKDVANRIGIYDQELEMYGNYVAKINHKSHDNDSKLILVTAINPTPYGEGKTTVSIGLNDALCSLGKKSIVCLREPSLGPVFGVKGGACGGGRASIVPEDEINLHFTGDFHAITAANNLLASAIDNHIYQGNTLNINPDRILFKRCIDINDRALRDKFNITAASEIMAIFCLASSLDDLKDRLANILVAYSYDNEPIYSSNLKVDNAMFLLLKKAFVPNIVQTLEGNPCLVHGGPFANIAHGCSSIVSLKLGLSISDYVITEAGFGSDLGCEKFMNITCREANFKPSFVVLVVTVRALNHTGIENLNAHIDHLKQYNVPFCVSINKFLEDNQEDIDKIIEYCSKLGIKAIVTNSYLEGGAGSIELANYILGEDLTNNNFKYLYDINLNIKDKIKTIAKNVYHANQIEFSPISLEKLEEINKLDLNSYPVCIAKTQYSISDNKDLLGYPKDYTIHVKDIEIHTGSKMIVVLLNNIIIMPGLPKNPNFEKM